MLHSPSSFEVSKPSLAGISRCVQENSSTPGELCSHSNYLISCCYRSAHVRGRLHTTYVVVPLDCEATFAVPSASNSTSPASTSLTAASTRPPHSGSLALALSAISATAARHA